MKSTDHYWTKPRCGETHRKAIPPWQQAMIHAMRRPIDRYTLTLEQSVRDAYRDADIPFALLPPKLKRFPKPWQEWSLADWERIKEFGTVPTRYMLGADYYTKEIKGMNPSYFAFDESVIHGRVTRPARPTVKDMNQDGIDALAAAARVLGQANRHLEATKLELLAGEERAKLAKREEAEAERNELEALGGVAAAKAGWNAMRKANPNHDGAAQYPTFDDLPHAKKVEYATFAQGMFKATAQVSMTQRAGTGRNELVFTMADGSKYRNA